MSVLKYNICLCYHGFVTDPSTDATFRSYVNDFESTIQLLLSAGYTFVFPSQMGDWYLGKTTIPLPAACIIMDDGLDTVPDVTDWLIANKIPFGFAVIARRNRLVVPESGYMTWVQIKASVDSGYGEILYHTYNMHHMCMTMNTDNQIEANPILDAPCYLDSPADFLYIIPGDTRWYWDYSFVDTCTWGFPLFGTDVYNNQLVTSTITFKAQQTLTVSIIRVWACLHLPPSSGYECQVEITVNGQVVFNNVIAPYQYETRSQWLERQFASITMATPFNVVAGERYTMVWTSQTNGPDLFRMYALPDFSGNYTMSTTCQGAPGTEDFPPGECDMGDARTMFPQYGSPRKYKIGWTVKK